MDIPDNKKWDKQWLGTVIGIIGPWIGFWVYYFLQFNHRTPKAFIHLFLNYSQIQGPILSLSLVFNLIAFFVLLKFNFVKTARGVLFATFLYVPVMIYLKYF